MSAKTAKCPAKKTNHKKKIKKNNFVTKIVSILFILLVFYKLFGLNIGQRKKNFILQLNTVLINMI